MAKRIRLNPVLRARQAQEDVAKGAVMRARAAGHSAAAEVRRRETALDGSRVPDGGSAWAVVAALAARQSLAAALAAANRAVRVADDETAERVAELTEAAMRRRSVEKLADRYAAEERQEAQANDQRMIDELAITDRQRSEARGVSS